MRDLERVFKLADGFADVIALAVLFEAVDEVLRFLEGRWLGHFVVWRWRSRVCSCG